MPNQNRKGPRRKPARDDGRELTVQYTPSVAREICERIARGEPWAAMCNTGRLPAPATLYAWRRRFPVFAEALAQAREIAREGTGAIPDIFNRLEDRMTDPNDESDLPVRRRDWPGGVKVPDANGATRKVRYTQALAEDICARLAGGELWSHFCNSDHYPSVATFYLWRREKPDFDAKVRAARQFAAEACFDQARAVALASTPATVASDKLAVETMLKAAAHLDRGQYGPLRVSAAGGSDNGEAPVRTIVIRHFENTVDENGREYLMPVDQMQVIE